MYFLCKILMDCICNEMFFRKRDFDFLFCCFMADDCIVFQSTYIKVAKQTEFSTNVILFNMYFKINVLLSNNF